MEYMAYLRAPIFSAELNDICGASLLNTILAACTGIFLKHYEYVFLSEKSKFIHIAFRPLAIPKMETVTIIPIS